MRKFKLINKHGREYDMHRLSAFFNSPDGLGWGVQSAKTKIGHAYIVTKTEEAEHAPSGDMVFDGYEEYQNFLLFCQIGGLVLGYKPLNKWYFLDVDINIQKSEIDQSSQRLICPITFTGLSYWYEKSEYQTGQRSEAGGKVYRYSYRYNYGSGPSSIFTFDLSLPSYFKMEIMGECKNPVWRVIQNGETVLSGKINADISSTHKLVVNTDPSEMEIGEYTKTNTFVKSLYGRSDFSTERIFALPAGQCTFAVLAEGTSRPNVFVEVKKHV